MFDDLDRPRIMWSGGGTTFALTEEEVRGNRKTFAELELADDDDAFSGDAMPYAASTPQPNIAAGCRRRSSFISPEERTRDIGEPPTAKPLRFE